MNDAKSDVLKDAKKDEKKDAKESFVIGVGMKGLRIEGSKVQQGAAGAAGDLQLCRQESAIVKPRCRREAPGKAPAPEGSSWQAPAPAGIEQKACKTT